MHVCGWVGRKWASECKSLSGTGIVILFNCCGGVSPPLKHPQQQQQRHEEENFLRHILTACIMDK